VISPKITEIKGGIKKKRGLDKNPTPFKIQYPMKNFVEDIYYISYIIYHKVLIF
jgi:hypothetical protein